MEFGFWTCLLRLLLLCRVANSIPFPAGVYRTECHDRHLMIAMDLSFTGKLFYFEAVDATGVFPITEQYAAQCGYTVNILQVPGLVEMRASYFSCQTTNENDNRFTFSFHLIVNRDDQSLLYTLNKTCSLPLPWSPREVNCEVNYLEVSVQSDAACPRGPKQSNWDSSMEMVYGFASLGWQVVFVNKDREMKPMSLGEARSYGYSLTLTGNRMVLRAAYGQPHSFSTAVDGFSVEVLHAVLFTRQDWLVLLVDLVAACTMHDAVAHNSGYMVWEMPQSLYPGVQMTNFSFGLNGNLRDSTASKDLGYSLIYSSGRVKIGIPYNAEGTQRRSVVAGGLFDLYTCQLYMEQLSSNGSSRVRTYRKMASPLIKSCLYSEDRTVPRDETFALLLGSVPDDAEFHSMQLKDQEFKAPFVNSSSYTLEIVVHPNRTYAYTLKVPFDSPLVTKRFSYENAAIENKLDVVFTLVIRLQQESFSHHTTVVALTTVLPPKLTTSCSKSGIFFKLEHQPSDYLWDVTVGSDPLTSELAAGRGYVFSNDSQTLQLDVPVFSPGYRYENISLRDFVGTFEVFVRDRKTFKIQSSSAKSCVFSTKEIIVCSKDGRMTVVADVSKALQAGVNKTTLMDASCAPKEADEGRALFDFQLNSCGTRVKLTQDSLTYENEIFFSLPSTTFSSGILVQCKYNLAGLYHLFTKYKFWSEIAGSGNILRSTDLLSSTTRPTRPPTRPSFARTVSRGVPHLGYKSKINYYKVSRHFKDLRREIDLRYKY